MRFFTMTRIYRDPADAISLRDVWTIVDGELNAAPAFAWERLLNSPASSVMTLTLLQWAQGDTD